MKCLTSILYVFFLVTSLNAQTRTMNNAALGRTYTMGNQFNTVKPLLQQADRQFRAFDYEESFLTLENAVAQNPNSFEALLMRAKFKQLIGMESDAKLDIAIANRINPLAVDLYGYHGNRGLLRILSIEPENAVKELNTFQRLNYYYQALDRENQEEDKDFSEWKKLEAIIDAIELDYRNDAMELLEEFLVINPNSAIAYDLKGVLLKKEGRSEEAVAAFTKAVELEPDFAIAWYNLALVEQSNGHFENAKAYLDKAIALQEDLTKAYFDRAIVKKQMGDQEGALKDYNTIIEMNGNTYAEAFVNRGLTKKILGDYDGAFRDLTLAIEEFPSNAKLWKNRGNLHLLFGLHRKAIDDYTQAILLDSNYAEAYFNRALVHFLLYDKISGCDDLGKSAVMGFEKAKDALTHFCAN